MNLLTDDILNIMEKISPHIYIFYTIFAATVSSLLVKWQINQINNSFEGAFNLFDFFLKLIQSPWIIFAIILQIFGIFSWVIALSKFELSYAYPFTIITYILIIFFSLFIFNESFSFYKALGSILVILGIFFISYE